MTAYRMGPLGMSAADQAEYLSLLGVCSAGDEPPEGWSAEESYCEAVDDVSGAVCTLPVAHEDAAHRDASDPMVVMSWAELPELLVVGAPVGWDDEDE